MPENTEKFPLCQNFTLKMFKNTTYWTFGMRDMIAKIVVRRSSERKPCLQIFRNVGSYFHTLKKQNIFQTSLFPCLNCEYTDTGQIGSCEFCLPIEINFSFNSQKLPSKVASEWKNSTFRTSQILSAIILEGRGHLNSDPGPPFGSAL